MSSTFKLCYKDFSIFTKQGCNLSKYAIFVVVFVTAKRNELLNVHKCGLIHTNNKGSRFILCLFTNVQQTKEFILLQFVLNLAEFHMINHVGFRTLNGSLKRAPSILSLGMRNENSSGTRGISSLAVVLSSTLIFFTTHFTLFFFIYVIR